MKTINQNGYLNNTGIMLNNVKRDNNRLNDIYVPANEIIEFKPETEQKSKQ